MGRPHCDLNQPVNQDITNMLTGTQADTEWMNKWISEESSVLLSIKNEMDWYRIWNHIYGKMLPIAHMDHTK